MSQQSMFSPKCSWAGKLAQTCPNTTEASKKDQKTYNFWKWSENGWTCYHMNSNDMNCFNFNVFVFESNLNDLRDLDNRLAASCYDKLC
jgi:hypothetical protein